MFFPFFALLLLVFYSTLISFFFLGFILLLGTSWMVLLFLSYYFWFSIKSMHLVVYRTTYNKYADSLLYGSPCTLHFWHWQIEKMDTKDSLLIHACDSFKKICERCTQSSFSSMPSSSSSSSPHSPLFIFFLVFFHIRIKVLFFICLNILENTVFSLEINFINMKYFVCH